MKTKWKFWVLCGVWELCCVSSVLICCLEEIQSANIFRIQLLQVDDRIITGRFSFSGLVMNPATDVWLDLLQGCDVIVVQSRLCIDSLDYWKQSFITQKCQRDKTKIQTSIFCPHVWYLIHLSLACTASVFSLHLCFEEQSDRCTFSQTHVQLQQIFLSRQKS